eukprot:scaffold4473_cov421-Prasinococcus_capsulatus_cf.AAC.11
MQYRLWHFQSCQKGFRLEFCRQPINEQGIGITGVSVFVQYGQQARSFLQVCIEKLAGQSRRPID